MDGLLGTMAVLVSDGNDFLAFFSGIIAVGVLLLCLVLFIGMIFTPRLCKRLLLPPILFLGFTLVWSMIFGDKGAIPLNLAEVLLGLGLIVGYHNPNSPAKWEIHNLTAGQPLFTFKNFLFTGLLNGALGLCMVAMLGVCMTQKARDGIEEATGKFLSIHADGITLEERQFRKGDREIRLLGMMHIAKSGFYDDVATSLPASARAVVLLEGVTDRDSLLKGKFDYERLARLFGFTSQKESSFTKKAVEGLDETRTNKEAGRKSANIEYQIADVDLADFKPGTVRFMQVTGQMLSSTSWNEVFQIYSASRDELEKSSATALDDILNKRNKHLLGEIDKALEDHTTVVVPWGAAHMPVIQEEIEKRGFVETKRSKHLAIHFENKTLIALVSLLDRLPDDSGAR